ncbi:uncharacterized protein BXZ73DRAFT_53794 [Epithele typhae]|uniref:uncharacterized protein n=1 Tax=Epithele typhae TaxID=378194 RepID=UPI0020080C4C|nr:uncharacterized protein BXZ73DRAFT_53794 [Epithele typhae]KAH9916587.1 hypothetical protein BXZ73DRAFT_53794 [Epithele typhae]
MTTTQPRKRPRLSGDAEDTGGTSDLERAETGRVRDAEFWFEDGSIVLIVGGVEFRVYKGILANASQVFEDMFALPAPPPSSTTTVYGCPVVELHDSADDVVRILRLVMPKHWYVFSFSAFLPLSVHPCPSSYVLEDLDMQDISAGIRLGHKYQMTVLANNLVSRLGQYYTRHWSVWSSPQRQAYPERLRGSAAIAVVNLAGLTGDTWMLPAAFMECLRLPTEELLAGFTRGDGTVEHLSPEDLASCVGGRSHLLVFETAFYGCILDKSCSLLCTRRIFDECTTALRGKRDDLQGLSQHLVALRDPTEPREALLAWADRELCSSCIDEVRRVRVRRKQARGRLRIGAAARVKDDEFWYEDGSITLVAEAVEFRVYKGVLANASPVFKDMFSLPAIPSSPDTTNIVALQDSADDVRRMLRLVLPKDCVHIAGPLEMWDISAGIRLGHKYEMKTLVAHLTKRLGEYYTSSWTVWCSPSREKVPRSFKGTAAIAVMNIARLTGANWLLPAAFLECCLLPPRELLAGFERSDGAMERLSTEDLATCLEAKLELMKAEGDAATSLCGPGPDCPDRPECRSELYDRAEFVINDVLYHLNPTTPRSDWINSFKGCLCRSCRASLSKRDVAASMDLFHRLPGFFGIVVANWGVEGAPAADI